MSGILSAFIGRVAGVVTDAYFNLVTLLLPGNGTNGAQNNTFLDSSSNNFTITRNGNTTQGTFSPFSQTGWSNYFDGSGDFLSWNSGSSVAFGTSDFTVEAFVYVTSTPNTKYIIDARDSSNTGAWAFAFGLGGTGYKLGFFDGTTTIEEATASIPNNSWQHCVAVRSGTTLSVYLNGSRVATATNSKNLNVSPTTSYIGTRYTGSGYDLEGYISNVRIIKGTAAYDPTQTTITVPTAPLTDVANTVLLTCASNRFFDKNTQATAKTITVNGTPSVQAFSPFAPTAAYDAATVGGSGYLDGTGDYLSVASNAAFQFGTGDFTVEAWWYPTTISSTYQTIAGVWVTGNLGWVLQVRSTDVLISIGSGFFTVTGSATIVANQWYHVAASRNGTTVRVFLNGTQLNTGTSSASGTASTDLQIGRNEDGNQQYVNGYLSSLRIVKGQGLATGSFTPPTAPVTTTAVGWTGANAASSITGTVSLLTNFTNAGITDATAKNDLETVGNAQISTTQSKFGGSSMYFDGTGDWALIANSSNSQKLKLQDSYTIECWIYPTNTSAGYRAIFMIEASAVVSFGVLSLYQSGSTLGFELRPTTGGAITSITGGTLVANTWQHIAISVSNNSGRLFLSGSQIGSTTSFSNYSFAVNSITVGGHPNVNTEGFIGYVNDFRVTKFARYTGSTLTVPAAAFPLQ